MIKTIKNLFSDIHIVLYQLSFRNRFNATCGLDRTISQQNQLSVQLR